MNAAELREKSRILKRIKKKFGTYSRFCFFAKIDPYKFQRMREPSGCSRVSLARLQSLVQTVENGLMPDEITEEKRMLLKSKIKSEYGNIYRFCQQNPQFSLATVFSILQGHRKKMVGNTKELYNHFLIF